MTIFYAVFVARVVKNIKRSYGAVFLLSEILLILWLIDVALSGSSKASHDITTQIILLDRPGTRTSNRGELILLNGENHSIVSTLKNILRVLSSET